MVLNPLDLPASAVRTAAGLAVNTADAAIDLVHKKSAYPPSHDGTDNLYDLACPMLDLSTIIYAHVFLRAEMKKRLGDMKKNKDLKDTQMETMENACNALRKERKEFKASESGGNANLYKTLIEQWEALQEGYGLKPAEGRIFQSYFDVLSLPKTYSEIQADMHLYGDAIKLDLFLYTKDNYELNSLGAITDKDPDAVLDHLDDEFVEMGPNFEAELCYGIAVSHKLKTVTVIFRGSVSARDWVQNVQVDAQDLVLPGYTGPTTSDDRKSFGKVHYGFYDYLFGKTREGKNGRTISKGEEIIGRVRTLLDKNSGYKLFVTGHSLGGALSTMMAFRAAVFHEIKQKIYNISFASPFVGDQAFRDEFYKLEKANKIVHLRVANDDDLVPLIPFSTLFNPPLMTYKHVGMHLKLYKKSLLTPSNRVFYPTMGSWPAAIHNSVNANVFLGLALPATQIINHLCPEYRARLDDAEEDLKQITLSGLYHDHRLTGWCLDPEPETERTSPVSKPVAKASSKKSYVGEFPVVPATKV